MKILNMLSDIFDELPKPGQGVKEFINEQRMDSEKTNCAFFHLVIQYLGGRSYNEFLDYSLLAIKLNAIYNKYCYGLGAWDDMQKAILKLLTDDRHDLWQNLPYYLNDVSKALDKEKGSEEADTFWLDIIMATIDCINVNGTGDISVNFIVKEE